jgi:hypothetical protein
VRQDEDEDEGDEEAEDVCLNKSWPEWYNKCREVCTYCNKKAPMVLLLTLIINNGYKIA